MGTMNEPGLTPAENKMQLSIVHKISLLTIALVVTTAGVVSGLFYQQQKKLMVQQTLDTFSNEVAVFGVQLQNDIEYLRADTRMLASVPPIQGLLRAQKNAGVDTDGKSTVEQWKQRLQTIFRALLEAKQNYLMARFIAIDGRELVRVDQINGEIIITRDQDLQNKAQRDYVIDTLKLPADSIYLSEINLNREHGKLVTPYQEVLRSAAPVYEQSGGKLAGLVVLNIDIGTKFHTLRQEGLALYITNDHGDYLLQPDSLRTYGFDHGQTYRLQDDFPSTARLFQAGSDISQLSLLPENTRSNQAAAFKKFHFDPEKPQRFFTIGISQPYDEIISDVLETLNKVIGIAIILIFMAALLSILLSQRLANPIKRMTRAVVNYGNERNKNLDLPVNQADEIGILAQSFQSMAAQVEDAENSLRKVNQNLESLVEKRTRELRSSEIRQQVIVENIVDGLISIDGQGIIQGFNRAAEKIFDYKAKDVIGRNIAILLPDHYAADHNHQLTVYHEDGVARIVGVEQEAEGRRHDGSIFPMEFTINEMWFEDQRFYSGIVRDITERKYVEKLKNEFISTVSHELRTPLTSIRGSLGLLLGGVVGTLPDKAMEMLVIASNNTARLLTLINDLLDIQKIESGKMQFHYERFPLMPFLEQVLREHAPYGEQHEVKFVITDTIEMANLRTDKARLTQVIGNLLSNAAKFSPPGATVEITVSHQHNDFLRISVTDVGPGIPKESLPSVFEQFTQVDSSDTRKKGGTGLGLAITKSIMEKLGGAIGVISEPGKGSTFYVDFPDADPEASTMNETTPQEHIRSNNRILIIENDPVTASLIQTLLAEAGHKADISHTARQARDMLQNAQTPYRLLLIDLILPDEDGISLLTSLRQKGKNRDFSVVIISVKADTARQELEGGALGIHDWISKPIDATRLVDTVQHLARPEQKLRVLHIEDEPDTHTVVSRLLENYCDITWTNSLSTSREKLRNGVFDLVLLDIGLPDGSGLDLIDSIRACEHPPQIVIFSALDVPDDYLRKVDAALLKTRTSNHDLLNAVVNAL